MTKRALVVAAALLSIPCFFSACDDSDSSSDALIDDTTGCDAGTLSCPCEDASCEDGLLCVDGSCAEDPRDWFTSSCEELGGFETAAGACFFPCSSNDDCGFGTECCNLPHQPYCRMGRMCGENCQTNEDCGPTGWVCHQEACYPSCFTDSGEEESPECPSGSSPPRRSSTRRRSTSSEG